MEGEPDTGSHRGDHLGAQTEIPGLHPRRPLQEHDPDDGCRQDDGALRCLGVHLGVLIARRAGIPGDDVQVFTRDADRISPLRSAGVVAWGDGVLVSDLAIAGSHLEFSSTVIAENRASLVD
jgi:hypothetical protein